MVYQIEGFHCKRKLNTLVDPQAKIKREAVSDLAVMRYSDCWLSLVLWVRPGDEATPGFMLLAIIADMLPKITNVHCWVSYVGTRLLPAIQLHVACDYCWHVAQNYQRSPLAS